MIAQPLYMGGKWYRQCVDLIDRVLSLLNGNVISLSRVGARAAA